MESAKLLLPRSAIYCKTPYDTVLHADALVLMTEWGEYRTLDLERLKKTMRGRVFIDLRNVYDPEDVRSSGLMYIGVGRAVETQM